jgi:hypothetical protein
LRTHSFHSLDQKPTAETHGFVSDPWGYQTSANRPWQARAKVALQHGANQRPLLMIDPTCPQGSLPPRLRPPPYGVNQDPAIGAIGGENRSPIGKQDRQPRALRLIFFDGRIILESKMSEPIAAGPQWQPASRRQPK